MDIKKTGHTCETPPEAGVQPYLLPDTALALFWMGRGAAILPIGKTARNRTEKRNDNAVLGEMKYGF